MNTEKITISDRNAIAFYMVNGQPCKFVDNSGRLEGVFDNTSDFQRLQAEFMLNAPVNVQSFIAASKMVSQMILRNREVRP